MKAIKVKHTKFFKKHRDMDKSRIRHKKIKPLLEMTIEELQESEEEINKALIQNRHTNIPSQVYFYSQLVSPLGVIKTRKNLANQLEAIQEKKKKK